MGSMLWIGLIAVLLIAVAAMITIQRGKQRERLDVGGWAGSAEPSLETVQQLIRRGRKIEAIKMYRALSGVGLKEAKDAVDALEQGRIDLNPLREEVHARPPLAAPADTLADLIQSGNKLGAIKAFRDTHPDVGLKAAKDAVDALERALRRR